MNAGTDDTGSGIQHGTEQNPKEPLGPALVEWNDYVGTAAADDLGPADGGHSFYEMTRLDPTRWAIVAVDLTTGAGAGADRLVVYAFDRSTGMRSHAEMLELAYRCGELPVTAFEVEDPVSLRDVVSAAFKQLAVRLTSRGLSDQRLAVVESVRLRPGQHPADTERAEADPNILKLSGRR